MDYTVLGDPEVESVVFTCMKNTYLFDHAFEPSLFYRSSIFMLFTM
jgi:hypothetical protein